MIGYLRGRILNKYEDSILLLAGDIGYEVILPVFVIQTLSKSFDLSKNTSYEEYADSSIICLYIYYYQTERQPKPILIGFNSKEEKEFFKIFISVDAIGPLKAVKAMEKAVSEIAAAIENQDFDFLSNLKGIGKRTAQKIVAALHGKVSRFIPEPILNSDKSAYLEPAADKLPDYNLDLTSNQPASNNIIMNSSMKIVSQQVVDVLIEQLGYTGAVAKKMVSMAVEKHSSISTPEQLLDAVLNRKL